MSLFDDPVADGIVTVVVTMLILALVIAGVAWLLEAL